LEPDSYKTISAPAQARVRERSSKFLAFAWPVSSDEQAKGHIEGLKKEFYDATHHCWAMRTGVGSDEVQRSNDDGEPAGTAGRPILGQILSAGLTNVLVVVVRYFGGTKLGVPGLIAAYKEAAADVIAECEVVERTVDAHFTLHFPYASMNGVMRVVKEMHPAVGAQAFDNTCVMELSIRRGQAEELRGRLLKCEGAEVDEKE
jgi:uncharacterized YigZ family protein